MTKLLTRRCTSGAALVSAFLMVACGGNSSNGGDCEANLLEGDLVITEIMANPMGADEGKEFFEIYNATTSPINVAGLTLISSRDDGTSEDVHTMREATIAPGQYFVVGGILDEFKETYMDYGAANDLSFRNSNGRLAMRCKDTTVDEVTYATAPDGASLELNGAEEPNHVRNDEEANFCEATATFDTDALGSPQAANGVCGNIAPGMCDEDGASRATVLPVLGDVIITEAMPNPEGADGDGEWIEVLALGDFDANGLTIGRVDGSVTEGSIGGTDCVSVATGDRLLFATNDDAATNGGLPTVDGTFGFSMRNTAESVQVSLSEVVLDVVAWEDSDEGISINLDPGSNDPVANDIAANFCGGSATYGDQGNLGTPRAENTGCVLAGQCLDGGVARPIVSPGAGEVTITEWHPNPSGSEPAQEWLEVQFSVDADLNGLQFGRDGAMIGVEGDTVDLTNCLRIPAGGFAVIAANADSGVNGGILQVDFDYACTPSSTCTMVNSNGTFFVGAGGAVLDTITWVSSTDGASIQIDGALQCNTPAGNAYGDGDLGTPGAANVACP